MRGGRAYVCATTRYVGHSVRAVAFIAPALLALTGLVVIVGSLASKGDLRVGQLGVGAVLLASAAGMLVLSAVRR